MHNNDEYSSENMTVGEAKRQMHGELMSHGKTTCPCCDSYSQVYKRQISKKMARDLISLYRITSLHTPHYYYHYNMFVNGQCGDFAKLRFWGLVELKTMNPDEQQDSSSSGCWRITERGMQYVTKRIALPQFAHVYRNQCVLIDGQARKIDEDRKNFNYEDLMYG